MRNFLIKRITLFENHSPLRLDHNAFRHTFISSVHTKKKFNDTNRSLYYQLTKEISKSCVDECLMKCVLAQV